MAYSGTDDDGGIGYITDNEDGGSGILGALRRLVKRLFGSK